MKADSRNIAMLLTFTVVFSVVGYERATATQTSTPPALLISPSKMILGGVVAGTLLIGMSHAGDAGAQFAQGLAIVAAATAILVNGGPVWSLIGSLYGKPTTTTPTPSNKSTGATTPTTVTGG